MTTITLAEAAESAALALLEFEEAWYSSQVLTLGKRADLQRKLATSRSDITRARGRRMEAAARRADTPGLDS